jgi:hypothetical protein
LVLKIILLSAVADSTEQFLLPLPTALTIFTDVGNLVKKTKMAIFKPKPSKV